MSLRLAHEPIWLSHGEFTVRLRPSLRAGLLMAQRYTLEELQEKIAQVHLGTISHLVAIGCDDLDKAAALIAAKFATGLFAPQDFAPQLFDFIKHSFGLSEGDNDDTPATGAPLTFTDALTELYEFATGWLQWSPAGAWAATPAEIIHARKGHFAMLRAIHGSAEEKQEETSYADLRAKFGKDVVGAY